MRVRRWAALAALVAAFGLAVAAAGYYVALNRPWAGWEGAYVDVRLEPGLAAGAVVDRLAARGVVRHPRAVKLWLRFSGRARGLHAGEYRFERPQSARQVVGRLAAGDVLLWAVTVPEGLTLAAVVDRFVETGLAEAGPLRAAVGDPALVADLDDRAEDLEGYLFPDTYHFPRTVAPGEIAAAMVGRFRTVADAAYRERARAAGLTLREAVTLASMIERETSVPGERRRISRVFHNRLDRNMRLQCDPTVIYALERAGHSVERLTSRDLDFDSPWNTYVARGLPPGPIANPGQASLEAAVSPSEGRELYFVAAPGGGHRFSEDLRAHQQAVAEWRRHSRSLER